MQFGLFISLIFWGGIGILLIIFGLRGIILKRPFFISFRLWYWVLVICFVSPILYGDNFDLSDWLNLVFYICMARYFYYSSWAYIFWGLTNNSLREALFAVLKSMNIAFEEHQSTIKLPAMASEIAISSAGWFGWGRIQVKQAKDRKLLDEIAYRMGRYIKEHKVEINLKSFWFEMILGAFMLFVAGSILLIEQHWGNNFGKSDHKKAFYQTGELQYEYAYDSNCQHKRTKEYYKNGPLKAEWIYEDKMIKESKEYNHDGILKAHWIYENEELNGVSKIYYDSGETQLEQFYKNGELQKTKEYKKDGLMVKEWTYEDGEIQQ